MTDRGFPRRLAPIAALLAGSAIALTAEAGARSAGPAIVVAQVPATALPTEAFGGGSLRAPAGEDGRLVLVAPDGALKVLTQGFASAADPEISFDGTKVLFAARKQKTDPWCIWEMKLDGAEPHRITCGAAGARQPVYQSTVYTITPTNVEPWVQVAFVGTDPGEVDEAGAAPNTSLWSCKTDGTALRRLTFNLSNDLDPVILPDGRMVYAGWLRHPGTRWPQGRVPLLGVNEDGSDYQIYAGDEGLRVKQMPAATADGRVVFVESDAVTGGGAGRLAAVSQRRPLHTYRSLSDEKDGLFRAPAGLPDGRLLVAWRPAANAPDAAKRTFGIYRFDPATRAREKVLEDPAWHSLQAKLVAARPMPDARSSVVREDDKAGKLYAIDVGINDLGGALPTGAAKRLRVVEGVPAAQGPPARRLLGEIPIAADGSFQVQIPANTPVQLQLLDADGLAIRTSAWLWVRNHAAQGCVGCHEDPERTPPNRFVEALQVAAPVLDLPGERRHVPGFAADVRPVVETRCRTCHGAADAAAALDTTPAGLAALAAPGEARRSPLIWHLLGRNTARPWDPEASGVTPKPVPADARPTPDEIRAFVEWIDLGGQP